jgi:hypothetical protein
MDITKMSLSELKALAYDELKKLEVAKYNISLIEKEISDKENTQEEKKEEKENGAN